MSMFIAVGGGSGSGKTFLAEALKNRLPEEAVILSYDSYYKDQSKLPIEQRALINYDDPAVLDEELFISHLLDLKAGRSIEIPQYDFSTHTRKQETLSLSPAPFIIVEGIMVYAIKKPKAYYDYRVYVDAESDIRLARRIVRDEKERGRTGDSVVKQYLATVRPMHKKYVEPTKFYADFIFKNEENDGIDETQMKQLLAQIETLRCKRGL